MNRDLLIGKVATILGKSFNEVAFHMNIKEQMESLVNHIENNKSKSISELVKEAYETAKSKGWHDEKREMGTRLALIHGEVSEAMEADRRGEGAERVTEELADVVIRIFDMCGEEGFDLEAAIQKKMEYNKGRSYKHGGKAY